MAKNAVYRTGELAHLKKVSVIPGTAQHLLHRHPVYGLLPSCKQKWLWMTGTGLRSYIRPVVGVVAPGLDEVRAYRPVRTPGLQWPPE